MTSTTPDCGFDTEIGMSCCWPIDASRCGSPSNSDPELVTRMMSVASSFMTRVSGYTVGQCSATIRPLQMCKVCRSWCCGGTDGIRLSGPMGLPVWDVTDVKIGPDAYDVNSWFFDQEQQMLWRTPPEVWPKKDERWSAPGTGEAFTVDVVVGSPPDEWALNVASILATELVASCCGDKCRIPKNATQVSGQGFTIQLTDTEISYMIPEVSAWVKAVNPFGARLPARVYSPDVSYADHRVRGCCGA